MWNHPSHESHIDNPDLVVSESASGQVSPRSYFHGLVPQSISYAGEQYKLSGVQELGHTVNREPASPTYSGPMKGYADSGKCSSLYESGRTDSGFVSGANILSSEQCLTDELSSRKYQDSALLEETEDEKEDFSKQSMRIDSGVDVGLPEQLSSLSLNDLNVPTKSHHESKQFSNINLTPYKVVQSQKEPQHVPRQQINTISWQSYFMQDDDGDTQLHIAIIQGFIEVVYSLIRMVPDPCYLDIPNDLCQTPLHLAVLTHQPRIVRRLLVAGASVEARDRFGNTALHLACMTGDVACLKELLRPVTVAETKTASLQYSVPLLPASINLEERNYDGQMCVHLAAVWGHIEILRHLSWFGANMNAREGKGGRTPLHYAVEQRNQQLISFLIDDCRVSLESTTFSGYTAYQLAVCVDTGLAQLLATKGALPRDLPDSEDESDSDEEMSYDSEDLYRIEINGEPIDVSA